MIKEYFWKLPHSTRRQLFSLLRPYRFQQLQKYRTQDNPDGFSYRSFDEHKCIFVHIPKAAGNSVAKALFGHVGAGHATVRHYQYVFNHEDFTRYFKFTFVRNPWSRVYSAYRFLAAGGMNEYDNIWRERQLLKYQDFEGFVLHGLNTPETLAQVHFQPQLHFLCVNAGQLPLVNFLGFYENLQADFQQVQQSIFGRQCLTLDHLNASEASATDYQSEYTPAMRQIVGDVYREDIVTLGYEFEMALTRQQIAARDNGELSSASK